MTEDQRRSDPPEAEDLAGLLKLTLIALVSALVSAVLVIAVGGAWVDRLDKSAGSEPRALLSEPGR